VKKNLKLAALVISLGALVAALPITCHELSKHPSCNVKPPTPDERTR